jgi:hypothetical protein|tara:strand:+ start:513 stop:905 length:393 start_codon:yes stop_codon:yes gene_type:complete
MSTLKVNTIQNTSAAHSSTPEQIAQGRAKAWINFNGTGTVAIRDSFNVSSITDNGQGDYTVTMTTAMSNTNYAVQATSGDGATSAVRGCGVMNSLTTTTFRVQPNFTGGTLNGLFSRDDPIVCCSVFGDS